MKITANNRLNRVDCAGCREPLHLQDMLECDSCGLLFCKACLTNGECAECREETVKGNLEFELVDILYEKGFSVDGKQEKDGKIIIGFCHSDKPDFKIII